MGDDLKLKIKPKFIDYDEASGAVRSRTEAPTSGATDYSAVACPKCEWKPSASDRWQCACGHRWNTFDTRGKCPACGKQWEDTACLECGKWSKHAAWWGEIPDVAAAADEDEDEDEGDEDEGDEDEDEDEGDEDEGDEGESDEGDEDEGEGDEDEDEGEEDEDEDDDDDEGVERPSAAFMKAMTPSPELARIVGAEPQPRTEVVKRVWQYIKEHGLQDKKNPRNINADEALRAVFGGKSVVNLFEMTNLMMKHLS